MTNNKYNILISVLIVVFFLKVYWRTYHLGKGAETTQAESTCGRNNPRPSCTNILLAFIGTCISLSHNDWSLCMVNQ